MAIAIGLVVVALSQSKNDRQDTKTADKVGPIATSLEKYISEHNEVPSSLTEANIKDVPATISYQKIDESSFKFCATFTRAGSIYDAGWTSLFTGALYGSQPSESGSSGSSTERDDYYIDTSIAYSHKKGENCQVVKPYITSDSFCEEIKDLYLRESYGCLDNDSSSDDNSSPNPATFTL